MSALEQLAKAYGVHTTVPAAGGAARKVGEETLRRVLAALGVAARDDAEAESALATLEQAAWTRGLPSVIVVRADAAAAPVVLPQGTVEVDVTIVLESGTRRRVAQSFTALPLLDARMIDDRVLERRVLRLGALPPGYHRLSLAANTDTADLIATPARCYLPERATGENLWGLAAQLYLLRSKRNWGVGDFTDLRMLIELTEHHGGDIVGINPLHMPFPDDPEHASPYSPASRLLLNPLNIDVAALPELTEHRKARELIASAEFAAKLDACRANSHVSYAECTALKRLALQALLEERSTDRTLPAELQAFRRERGAAFERHCVYFALRRAMLAEGHSGDWRQWPEPLRDCRSAAVARFAAEHAAEIDAIVWEQWLADRQLGDAARAAGQMRIGLYRDLAVGADGAGAETWSEPELVVPGMSVGAPPDPFSIEGQDWGLPPLNPLKLREQRYRTFIELLRANMRHAGALRIDHAMGLERLFFVPHGSSAKDGTYVDYPREELLGILALESHRHRCVVIGEDLGTVPTGFRVRMSEANVLSYRVLMFEREPGKDTMIAPEEYPDLAIAVAGNHDLPTLAGWWECTDIELGAQLGVLDDAARSEALRARHDDKQALCTTLRDEGLIGPDETPSLERLTIAVHRLLGRTNAMLATAQLDDLALEREPVNMPSTQRYPNWRRKLGLTLEELAASPRVAAQLDALAAERRGGRVS